MGDRMRGVSRRVWTRVGEVASRRRGDDAGRQHRSCPEQPPEAVLDFLRHLGVAMCRAGDAADRVTVILEDVAKAFDARGVSFFVLPTGVFVRIEAGESSRVDFAPGGNRPLRLDQVDDLYRLIDDIRHAKVTVEEANAQLGRLLAAPAAVPELGAGARHRRPHGRSRPAAQPDRDAPCPCTSASVCSSALSACGRNASTWSR